MKRIYDHILAYHYTRYPQTMTFLAAFLKNLSFTCGISLALQIMKELALKTLLLPICIKPSNYGLTEG